MGPRSGSRSAFHVFTQRRIPLERVNILIVKLGAIGDIIHTLPTLAAIRDGVPNATISWVAEERSAEVLRGNPLIDNLIEVDTRALRVRRAVDKMLIDAAKQVKGLRRHNFDISIDFQGLLKSAVISKVSGAKERWGFSRSELREPASRVFYTDTAVSPPMTHVIRRNLALAEAALDYKLQNEQIVFPIFTSDAHKLEAAEIAARAGGRFAILNPAGGWVTKLWSAENYGRLADLIWDRLGLRSIVVTGPNEAALSDDVVRHSACGKTIATMPSLKGFYELSKLASVYVGGDTGPTHLAIAAGAPIVGIFGPTEWWRNGSLDPLDVCIERLDIGCRVDCHRRTCSNWICMDIAPETVLSAVQTRLASVPITQPVSVAP